MAGKTTEYQISEFRNHVPEAFDHVIGQRGRMVRVVRRGTAERAVLLSEAYLERLQARVHELQRQLAASLQARAAAQSFRLIGSAELMVPPDEVFSATRAEQAALTVAKQRQF